MENLMTGFIIVLICITGSIAWGVVAGRKRHRELHGEKSPDKEPNT
jgi:hypothetical protein